MRGNFCWVLALVEVASLPMPVVSQVPTPQKEVTANSKVSPPAQLPYMAQYKTLRIQTRADGTSITHESTVVTARDAQGRQMTATTDLPASADQKPVTHFQVFDPVAHLTFTWSFPGQKATLMAIPIDGALQMSCGSASFSVQSMNCATKPTKETVEELGTKTIQRVEARGRRTLWTTPSEYIGKQKKHVPQVCPAKVSSFELWRAIDPGLAGLTVRMVSEDAPSGKTTKELVKFSQSEPDAAVFRPPASYEVVNREVDREPCITFEGMEPPAAPNPLLPGSPQP
jgi:hypothetical protein